MIKIHKVTKIGSFHQDYCEDYAVHADVGKDRILISVLDGCTMGTESYFASALTGKILRKICRAFFYKNYLEKKEPALKDQLKLILQDLFAALSASKNDLMLEQNEILSTVVLGVVDLKEDKAEFLVIGDGLICINGELIEFDQDNVPDYLAYHIHKPFDQWYDAQEQFISVSGINDISISTDGIFTFSKYDNRDYLEKDLSSIINYLLLDDSDLANERMFIKKLNLIEQDWGLLPTDDLGIIRLVKQS